MGGDFRNKYRSEVQRWVMRSGSWLVHHKGAGWSSGQDSWGDCDVKTEKDSLKTVTTKLEHTLVSKLLLYAVALRFPSLELRGSKQENHPQTKKYTLDNALHIVAFNLGNVKKYLNFTSVLQQSTCSNGNWCCSQNWNYYNGPILQHVCFCLSG